MNAPRFLLDTNICIYIARHKPAAVLARFQKLRTGEAVVSVITYGELQFGAAKSRDARSARAALDEFSSLVAVLPLPAAAADCYGAMRASLEQRGLPIGGNDLWIAAHAQAAELVLVTNNENEFRRIPDLKTQNWV